MMSSILLPSELSDEDLLKCVICTNALENPVLLNCLHSACRSCICDMTGHVTCPVCRVTTDPVAATAAGKTNLLVSSLVHRSRVIQNMFSCAHCVDEDKQDAAATMWCYTCQQPLCADFLKYHNKLYPSHKIIHLTEQTVLSELYHPPLRCCKKHGEELRFACFTCCDGCCIKCAHCCYTSSHDIQPLEDVAAVERISDRVTRASRFLSDLSAINVLLQSHLRLSEKFAIARQESLAELSSAKKTAMDSISRAYINAEKSLLDCWDTITCTSFHCQESVEILKKRMDWTNKYCQMAINSNDVAGLLPQLETMSSSLSTLLDEARLVKEPDDPLKMVSINICLPRDLDLITSSWFGMAKVVSDDLSCSVKESPADNSSDNYALNASLGKEAGGLLEKPRENREDVQRDVGVMQLPGEHLLASTTNEVENQLDRRSECHEYVQHENRVLQPPSEQLLASDQEASDNEAGNQIEMHNWYPHYLQRKSRVVQLPSEQFLGKEVGSPLKAGSEHRERLQHKSRVVQPPSEQLLVSTTSDVEKDRRSHYYKYLQQENRVLQPPSVQLLEVGVQTGSDDEAENQVELQNLCREHLQHKSRSVRLPGKKAGSFLKARSEHPEFLQHKSSVVQPPSEQVLVPSSRRTESLPEKPSEYRGHLQHKVYQVLIPSEKFGDEAGNLPEKQNEYDTHIQSEFGAVQLPSEQLLTSLGNEAGNLREQRRDDHEYLQHESLVVQPPSEHSPETTDETTRAPCLAFSGNEACSHLETRSDYHEHLLCENSVVQLPSEQLLGNDAGIQLEKRKEFREHAQRENCVVQLQSRPLFAFSGNEARQVPYERNEYHEQFQREYRAVSPPNEPLSDVDNMFGKRNECRDHFDSQGTQERQEPSEQSFAQLKPLCTFKGPGKCWDVAVTLQGRLLVAATSDGLIEYDATSLREISTWKPDRDLLGEHTTAWVSTVDALTDGRAVVGLFFSKQVVLLRRDFDGDRAYWRTEQRVAELQAPPRHLSAYGEHLLAVLEDRFEERTMSWHPGPGVALFSLSEGRQLLRKMLDYDACSVALSYRTVIVTSNDAIELLEKDGGCSGYNKKSYVVDCFNHNGIRLWRHVGLKVMSVCTDSVGPVLYAARSPGSVVVLSVHDGRELSTAISLKDTEQPYAIGFDKATRRMLALLSLDGNEPNVVTIFGIT